FPEPLRFDPERWTSEFRAALPKYAYFPFGGGPRRCIGEGFAWMEATLFLATLAQQWKLRLRPGHRVIPQPLVTLRPKHGLHMIALQRETLRCALAQLGCHRREEKSRRECPIASQCAQSSQIVPDQCAVPDYRRRHRLPRNRD